MSTFQQFLAGKPFGFLKDTDIPELTKIHRLCQCLIRYGCGRCIVSAQDVPGMVRMIEKSGDYVRDVAITSTEIENAHKWQAEPTFTVPHTTPEQRQAIRAPELLEALKGIKELAKYGENGFGPDIAKICDTAIQKAEGL